VTPTKSLQMESPTRKSTMFPSQSRQSQIRKTSESVRGRERERGREGVTSEREDIDEETKEPRAGDGLNADFVTLEMSKEPRELPGQATLKDSGVDEGASHTSAVVLRREDVFDQSSKHPKGLLFRERHQQQGGHEVH
jgi:hypothetical protein